MQRFDIINGLIKKNNYKTYLEIGLDNPNNNYLKIICENKECVDPFNIEDHLNDYDFKLSENNLKLIDKYLTYKMTSDEFFNQNVKTYDIIFIDGLHTKEQVGKDIINALKCLNNNGKIVVHDCLPTNEKRQLVPRQTIAWNGNVWQSIPELKKQNIIFNTVDADEGCCIIDFNENFKELKYIDSWEYTYEDFIKNKKTLMNVISVDEFNEMYLK